MKAADSYTIREKKIPSLILMERAARTFVETVLDRGFDLSRVCVVCGSGNNGGDGFAIARLLLEKGARVTRGDGGQSGTLHRGDAAPDRAFQRGRGRRGKLF